MFFLSLTAMPLQGLGAAQVKIIKILFYYRIVAVRVQITTISLSFQLGE